MLKKAISYSFFICLLAGCSSLKTAFNGNRQAATANNSVSKKELKFLDQDVTAEPANGNKRESVKEKKNLGNTATTSSDNFRNETGYGETISSLQNKYAHLLNTSPVEVKNIPMYEFIDEWYGTPYKLGGVTKIGIDCSAFTQYLFASVYNISLPRTTKEQYKLTSRVSRTELKEGDLIFFNTRGGVSHVGVYLQNNKFVHASTSGGVMISDIFEEYWVKRFVGVGRMNGSVASSQ